MFEQRISNNLNEYIDCQFEYIFKTLVSQNLRSVKLFGHICFCTTLLEKSSVKVELFLFTGDRLPSVIDESGAYKSQFTSARL